MVATGKNYPERFDKRLGGPIEYLMAVGDILNELEKILEPEELITFRNEQLIAKPKNTVKRIYNSLSLKPHHWLLERCAKTIYNKPSNPRKLVKWEAKEIRNIRNVINKYKWYKNYKF